MTIQTKWPLRHDGVYYGAGEIISVLPPDEEHRLVHADMAVMCEEEGDLEEQEHTTPKPDGATRGRKKA